MDEMAKWLMLLGGALVVIGGLLWLLSSWGVPLGRLPGDIRIERDNVRFYFPLATCILLSLVLSLVVWLMRR